MINALLISTGVLLSSLHLIFPTIAWLAVANAILSAICVFLGSLITAIHANWVQRYHNDLTEDRQKRIMLSKQAEMLSPEKQMDFALKCTEQDCGVVYMRKSTPNEKQYAAKPSLLADAAPVAAKQAEPSSEQQPKLLQAAPTIESTVETNVNVAPVITNAVDISLLKPMDLEIISQSPWYSWCTTQMYMILKIGMLILCIVASILSVIVAAMAQDTVASLVLKSVIVGVQGCTVLCSNLILFFSPTAAGSFNKAQAQSAQTTKMAQILASVAK